MSTHQPVDPTSVPRGPRSLRSFGRHLTSAATLFSLLSCLASVPSSAQYPGVSPTQDTVTSSRHARGAMPADSTDPGDNNNVFQSLSTKQKRYIVHANFEKSKSDAAELAALAKGLRQELDKPGANPLSAEVMTRIEKIQKLAKKIRDETKGF